MGSDEFAQKYLILVSCSVPGDFSMVEFNFEDTRRCMRFLPSDE